jgi:hypothetical protein
MGSKTVSESAARTIESTTTFFVHLSYDFGAVQSLPVAAVLDDMLRSHSDLICNGSSTEPNPFRLLKCRRYNGKYHIPVLDFDSFLPSNLNNLRVQYWTFFSRLFAEGVTILPAHSQSHLLTASFATESALSWPLL